MTERQEIIRVQDMMEILGGLSYQMACKKIREVKSISDLLGIRGVIHRLDWENYLNRFNKKEQCLNLVEDKQCS